MKSLKKIFIDFGNTNIKVKKQNKILTFSYDNLTELKSFLFDQQSIIVYFIKTKFDFHNFVFKGWWPKHLTVIEIKPQQVLKHLSLDYQIANKQIGIDLLLMWYYVVQQGYDNALIICYGTWTSFLNISNAQLHDVGILPGLLKTKQLMFNDKPKTKFFSCQGTNNNCIFGYANYLILEGLTQYCLKTNQQLIISGGIGNQIAKKFKQPNCLFIKELCLLGLELFVNFIVLKTKIQD